MKYTIAKDTEINATVIKEAIDYNEKRRERFDTLDRYYIGDQDILHREKPDLLHNNKVMINHAKYIVDTNVGYLLGNPVEYQASDKVNIDAVLDCYKKQTMNDNDSEIAKNCAIFGLQYEYVFANEDAEPESAILDVRNTIIVYDNTIKHNKMFAVNYRPIFKKPTDTDPEYYDVIFVDNRVVRNYRLKGENLILDKEDSHAFKEVPMIEFVNNKDYLGDFETVVSLIDAYNLIQSDRVNDREQLVDAILCFYGMKFTPEQMAELKEHRMISNIPMDGKIEYLIKTLNESDTDILRKNIENDIHKISMTPNLADENFANNSSGVAISYKLLAFDQNIKNKERYFERGLMERFRLYNNFLNTKSSMPIVPTEEVDAIFKRNLPRNDYETSQMILNLQGIVDKELLVSQLSFVRDSKETVELAAKEDEATLESAAEFAKNEIKDANNDADEVE
ncbi:MAG: phage portal protein [Candidatus Saccharibacteria bacterium]|nr:phage portal protein [Candidatus Saccharibacteria bacterium]